MLLGLKRKKYFRPVTIEKVGLASDLLIVGEVPSQVRLTLRGLIDMESIE